MYLKNKFLRCLTGLFRIKSKLQDKNKQERSNKEAHLLSKELLPRYYIKNKISGRWDYKIYVISLHSVLKMNLKIPFTTQKKGEKREKMTKN